MQKKEKNEHFKRVATEDHKLYVLFKLAEF